ncbi:macrocin O-methyltransferase [Candidatus Gracilibacteria bacterium]|nr:macrocin O-methyltransferase [Candidatus Gracilibacteria bacterium]
MLRSVLAGTLYCNDATVLERRHKGLDIPDDAHTMIGVHRLNHLKQCIDVIMSEGIEGDFIECGVWKGGACIFIKAVLEIYQDNRNVWVADSFKGFPNPKFNWDKGCEFLTDNKLSISQKEVEDNFKKYDLFDDRIKFVEGFFGDTLPHVNGKFSLLRADGDLFESTIDILVNLYDKVSVGGFVIIDDMLSLPNCFDAVKQFREQRNIVSPMYQVDHTCGYWRKEE